MRFLWNVVPAVSPRNSAEASIPWRGDLSSCEILPIKSPFCLSARTVSRRDISAMTVFVNEFRKVRSVAEVSTQSLLLQTKHAEVQSDVSASQFGANISWRTPGNAFLKRVGWCLLQDELFGSLVGSLRSAFLVNLCSSSDADKRPISSNIQSLPPGYFLKSLRSTSLSTWPQAAAFGSLRRLSGANGVSWLDNAKSGEGFSVSLVNTLSMGSKVVVVLI